jgi:NAD(P)-dependent dehydrogenase (short-subunit alcohol dehydrogenase family)
VGTSTLEHAGRRGGAIVEVAASGVRGEGAMDELSGKVAVVTGGASGIGLAMAKRFATEGARIVLADVEADALGSAEEALRSLGAEVLAVETDVSSAAAVDELAAKTFERFGTAHVVCNNAGVGPGGVSWEIPEKVWEWVLSVDLVGVINGIRSFVPRLVEQQEGHVVNTSSYVGGLFGAAGHGPYCAAKFGVIGASIALAGDLALAKSPVKVSVLCPGGTATRMNESGRNWPSRLGPPPPGGLYPGHPSQRAFFTGTRNFAKDPAEVADAVVSAIRDGRFWVVTDDHLEEDMAAYVEAMTRGELFRWDRRRRATT